MLSSVWRLNRNSSLHFRRWDDQWAVFDTGSGQTHEIDSIIAVTLMHCEGDWIGLADISAGVALDLDLISVENLSEKLHKVLIQFTKLELLEFRLQ